MQQIILDNREKIADLCRQHHVRRLSVFGSAARDDFDPARSDVDLIVDFEPIDVMEYAPNYFALLRSLDRLFGRRVDRLTNESIRNPYFRRSIKTRFRSMARDLTAYWTDILDAGEGIANSMGGTIRGAI